MDTPPPPAATGPEQAPLTRPVSVLDARAGSRAGSVSRPGSTLPTPGFSTPVMFGGGEGAGTPMGLGVGNGTATMAAAAAQTGGGGAGGGEVAPPRPVSTLMGNAPVFVPGAATTASLYRPKLKLAFPPPAAETVQQPSALAQRRRHRRNTSSRSGTRGDYTTVPLQTQPTLQVQQGQGQAYMSMPAYSPGFVFSPSVTSTSQQQQAQQQQQSVQQQEHPLARWWKHFTPEELDSLQNALQDLMFTASRLVDEDSRRLSLASSGGLVSLAGARGEQAVEEVKKEAWEMREAQARVGQWVQELVQWREGLPAGDPRSKN